MDQRFICNKDICCSIVYNGRMIGNHLNIHIHIPYLRNLLYKLFVQWSAMQLLKRRGHSLCTMGKM